MTNAMNETPITAAIIGVGQMGAAVGGRLRVHGARVITETDGRSPHSIARAKENAIESVPFSEIGAAKIILSIVPPGEAKGVMERTAALLRGQSMRPLFVDCNALSPSTKRELEEIAGAAGVAFQDAAIIGYPPGADNPDGPIFYTSGKYNSDMRRLSDFGLIVKPIDESVGSASALKMSFGGINKGFTALAAAMALQARRMNSEARICNELAQLMPQLSTRFTKSVPQMYPKAYRWVAEMREIATFLKDDPEAAMIFEALARFYEKRADDHNAAKRNK